MIGWNHPQEGQEGPQPMLMPRDTNALDFGGYWRVMRGTVALMTGLDSETAARRWAEDRDWEVAS